MIDEEPKIVVLATRRSSSLARHHHHQTGGGARTEPSLTAPRTTAGPLSRNSTGSSSSMLRRSQHWLCLVLLPLLLQTSTASYTVNLEPDEVECFYVHVPKDRAATLR